MSSSLLDELLDSLEFFKIHLPVFYGKFMEDAFGRLLAEIISQPLFQFRIRFGRCHYSPTASLLILYYLTAHGLLSDMVSDSAPYAVKSWRPYQMHSFQFAGARKPYNTLAKSPHPRFVNHRLKLSCAAYHVMAVKLL